MSELSVQKSEDTSGTVVLRLTGPLTLATLSTVLEAFRTVTAPHAIVEMSGVPHMDSAGLGSLLTFLTAQKKNNGRVSIAAPAKRVMTLIELTKVNTVMPVFATVEEAEQG